MALRRFSDNPAATLPLTGAETLPALQAGVDVQLTVQDVIDAVSGAVTSVNGATGAVVLELGDLDDVDVTGVADGDVLTWDAGASEWVPEAPSGGGSGAWGTITGTLSSQTDLQAALDAKASAVVDVITPTNSSGTVTLDFDGKSKYVGEITLAANVTTLAVSNLPGAGKYAEYELHIKQDPTTPRTFAIPASHKALGGSDTAISATVGVTTVLTASTVDNGTTWRYAMQESA